MKNGPYVNETGTIYQSFLIWQREGRYGRTLVSRSGLEFHAHNYVLRTPWGNVVSVTSGREILLREPALVGKPLYLNRGESAGTLAQHIPLEMFHNGCGTELYYDLRRHMPHLCP